MGRYDGEDYAATPRCSWGNHSFQMNGSCHKCRRTREGLIAEARRIVAEVGMGDNETVKVRPNPPLRAGGDTNG